jgi:hypothetical protein
MMRGAESCICLPQRHAGDSIRSDDDIEGLSKVMRLDDAALWTRPCCNAQPVRWFKSVCAPGYA